MSGETSTATPGRIAGVEVRSIDYVPLNERHGKVWSQGPLTTRALATQPH